MNVVPDNCDIIYDWNTINNILETMHNEYDTKIIINFYQRNAKEISVDIPIINCIKKVFVLLLH